MNNLPDLFLKDHNILELLPNTHFSQFYYSRISLFSFKIFFRSLIFTPTELRTKNRFKSTTNTIFFLMEPDRRKSKKNLKFRITLLFCSSEELYLNLEEHDWGSHPGLSKKCDREANSTTWRW